MIRYALTCGCGHEFEAWFGSIRAFDELSKRSEISCPACGGADVRKALMAPRIASSAASSAEPASATPSPASPASDADVRDAFLAAARRLHQEVKSKADYVGPQFAEEARRIDAGEAPDRGIYGEATAQEARALIDDGITVLPLPRLPEDHN